MSVKEWPRPAWFDNLDGEDRDRAEQRFLVCMAALFADPRMTLDALANRMGHSVSSLSRIRAGQVMSADVAVKLETVCGREHFPREAFRPDLFTLPTE